MKIKDVPHFSWFLMFVSAFCLGTTHAGAQQILEVDAGGSTPYKTIASAVAVVRPGDTIRIKPGSGPYREALSIRTSGTEKEPIVVDGGNNLITGFDPVENWEVKDGLTTCRLKAFPCVIAYKGERLVQDAETKQFTKYATINEAKDTLTLLPGVEKTGWEISARDAVVQIHNASHHIYRNIRASGSLNDGFGMHGTGTNLLFENIEAFQNLDEGYSTHDRIVTIVRGAKFWGNDNGIANSFKDRSTVSSTFIDTDVHDNLGFGLSLRTCAARLENVRVWRNGMRQMRINDVELQSENVRVYTPAHTSRQVISYTDSRDTEKMITYSISDNSIVNGTVPETVDADAP